MNIYIQKILALEGLNVNLSQRKHPDEAWAKFEDDFGVRLPADYKELVNIVDPCWFKDQFIWVLDPFNENLNANLPRQFEIFKESFERVCGDISAAGYRWYPEPGGILIWGMTENADTFFWSVREDLQSWPIVGLSNDGDWEEWDLPFCEFLYCVLAGDIKVGFFPDNFS